ncbi:MAG TPA: carbohydrate-binding protein, partial [Deinococcales bacterium]|nr:carbohydrate-binding protein [Deinococcales bacterium]
FVRGLSSLARIDPAYLGALQDNAVQAWNHRRADGLTGTNWAQTAVDAPLECLAASSAATAILAAPRAETAARVVAGSGLYEAENAHREGVGSGDRVEHSGRGYVNAFNRAGQALEFSVNVPNDGPYTLTWRYAAGAGDATRSLDVNDAASRAAFPGTPGWDGWATTGQTLSLRRGTNVVRLAFQPGDANYLNLDWLQVQAAPASPSSPAGGPASPAQPAGGEAGPAIPRS